jgi:hypothetical protein
MGLDDTFAVEREPDGELGGAHHIETITEQPLQFCGGRKRVH